MFEQVVKAGARDWLLSPVRSVLGSCFSVLGPRFLVLGSCVRQNRFDSGWQPSRWRDETILFILPS